MPVAQVRQAAIQASHNATHDHHHDHRLSSHQRHNDLSRRSPAAEKAILIHSDGEHRDAADKAKKLKTAVIKGSTETTFETLLNPTRLEGTAPAHERLADLGVYKLNWVGKFERRRLIISEKGELFICASTRGVTKEGIFKKRFSNWFDTMRNIMTFQERYFVLADGTFKYWKDKEDRDKIPGRPQGTINVMDAEITVVRDREEQGYIWFLTEGITGEIHELANETASLRQMWLSAISRNLVDLEQEELLDSIPVMEITALSRLEDDWATLSSFGMLPSQASAAGSAERSGSPERSGPHGSLGSGEKGAHASTAVERLRRHASILGTSKYYLTGGRNDDSFRTPRMAQRLDDQAADHDGPVDGSVVRTASSQQAILRKSSFSYRAVAGSFRGDDEEADDENGLPIGFRPEARNFDYHPGRAFTIQTVPNGHNSGKVFIFATDTVEECAECMSKIEEVQRATQKQIADEERSQRLQLWSRRIVTSTCVQSLVAVMITSTFFLAVVEAQVMYAPDWGDGDDSAATAKLKEETMHSFETVSKILTVFFIVELALNMTAFWFWEFWGNGWFLFDTFVVGLSVVELILPGDMPGVKQMRVVRSFRVFRLFGRLPQLRVLIDSLLSSLVPISYSFLIMAIFFGIFATIGVELFYEDAPDEFATFARSMYTLFGVVAYGRWPDDKLSAFDEEGKMVVIAVLLDNFFRQGQMQQEKAEEKLKAEEQKLDNLLTRRQRYHLDLFLEYLSQNFYSEHDLNRRINRMYRYLDSDRSGGVSFLELSEGLYRLHIQLGESSEDIQRMTEAEFKVITHEESFRQMILMRLRLYIQRKTADAIKYHQDSLDTEAMLVCLKFSTLQYSGPHKQGDTATSAVKAVEDDEGRRRGQGGREKPEAEHEYHVQDVYFTDPVLGKEEVSTGSGNSSEKQQGRVTLQDVIEKLNVVQAQQERMQAQQDQLALLLRGLGPQTCATETTRDTEEKVEQPHHHRDHVNAYGHGKNDGSVPIDAEFSVRLSPASTPETPQSEADLKTHASGSS